MKFLYLVLFFIQSSIFAGELRIVSLAPNLTEILYALNLGKYIVGNTVQCDYPKESLAIYKVGNYIHPNIERILNAHPNYVLATLGNNISVLNKLKLQGISVIEVVDPKNIEELENSISQLGSIFHVASQAAKINIKIKNSLQDLSFSKQNNTKFKFLFVLQYHPTYSITNNTWLGNLFTLAGFTNTITSTGKISYPILSNEYLIQNKPDIIFISQNKNFSLQENNLIEKRNLEKIFGEKESKNIRIIFLPQDIFMRPGPRVVEAIKFLKGLSF